MLKLFIPILAVFMFGGYVFANSAETMGNTRVLSWNDFKASCANPVQFQSQRPPQDIKIICRDLHYSWVPVESGQLRLATAPRIVTSEVYSDKFHVAVEQHAIASGDGVGACARFKEVAQTVTTERAVTCDEMLAYKGEPHDFCASVSVELLSQNPAAAQLADTGRTMDTCAAVVPAAVSADRDPARDAEERTKRMSRRGIRHSSRADY